MSDEDVKAVQSCLDILTDQTVDPNGHYGAYTEKAVKNFQEKYTFGPYDGVVTETLWEKMKCK